MSTDTDVDYDVKDPTLSRFDLVKEGARRDGVEIVHYAPRFPKPGTRAERRVERTIALLFGLTGLLGLAFVVAYIWWPWEYQHGTGLDKFYNPVLGLTLGGSLACLGAAIVVWAKKLLPEEVSIQDRHDAPDLDERALTGATIMNMVDETGIKRRPLLKGALLVGAAPLGLAAAAPLVGGLIKKPGNILFETAWKPANGNLIKVTREDGSEVRPEDVSVGGQATVFPGVPHGATNQHADSPVLLIHLRQKDADALRANLKNVAVNSEDGGAMWGNYVAYSKICTHAGCPASLYEQQTNRLLCPCHQSQFQITDNARPVFGPATRRLPMLPLTVENGVFVAKSDFRVPIGPGFWERP
ncbi:cytochrome bc1 complex Rieske iron-sulfur subunit [Planosporangium mesophilum]|uniref:Cytochrome bc1 complex Rieske iron-sulfur subunit n=1 Tax=Planosporangium mesophilum TaxID=689768 RepID=A0A8J3X2J7_9ACTN|nr:Rieske 2Fe-2S domain-containing protein [Planosporangium mesophilum]NJC83467.1 Rieske (2Fe-2S) protein [Planosporangium mesophilum]GII21978.1 putative ubiquinol-cytochrome c reductase iron-sulfur subunit (Rieske iron-sulfur protein) [Planosporangium mesophilum]